jgi:diguanylate cyclase (GGDEF)-like protein
MSSGTSPYMNTDAAWCIAALIALPPLLACGIVVLIFAWSWPRIWRKRRPLYRWIFSGATVVLGTQAAAAVLALDPHTYPGVPTGLAALGLVVLAAGLRWLINFSMVAGAMLLSSPTMRAVAVFENIGERVLEIGALGLGLAAAAILTYNPMLLAGIVVGVAAMHRGVLVAQFRKAARIDTKTGLDTAGWWQQLAEHAFQRAHATSAGLAVLMIDLDHFKRINDTYGHIAGDHVLRSVAHAITSEIRDSDTAGRWGGEEFVILVPDVNSAELRAIAERVRRRIHALIITAPGDESTTVQDLTASLGGARYPSPGINTIDDLVLAADTALYQAKKAGRDQVVTSD